MGSQDQTGYTRSPSRQLSLSSHIAIIIIIITIVVPRLYAQPQARPPHRPPSPATRSLGRPADRLWLASRRATYTNNGSVNTISTAAKNRRRCKTSRYFSGNRKSLLLPLEAKAAAAPAGVATNPGYSSCRPCWCCYELILWDIQKNVCFCQDIR